MSQDHDRLNRALRDAAVSKTIYALVMPETEAVIDRVLDGGDRARMQNPAQTAAPSLTQAPAPNAAPNTAPTPAQTIEAVLRAAFAAAARDDGNTSANTPTSAPVSAPISALTSASAPAPATISTSTHAPVCDPAALASRIAQALSENREDFRAMYREAWTQKQDALHDNFFETWKQWSAPVVTMDGTAFPYMYPTAGASEALREAIHAHGIAARHAGREPVIHVFAGEYEGFAAYAAAAQIRVVAHDRARWRDAIAAIGPDEQFYISQPSAIDGNVWTDFDDFAQALHTRQPRAQLMLDLTYVGCVAREFHVNAAHPNIPALFFSLSKPMGAYYHRVGGCLSRAEYPGLFGNKWFKNLMALRVGTAFMETHGVYDLPRQYRAAQLQATAEAAQKLDLPLKAADVYLLATAQARAQPSDLERYLTRSGAEGQLVRVCLTPRMAKIIDEKTDSTVRARPHEGLSP